MTTVATTIPAIWVALFRQAERITSDAHNDNDRSRANNVGVSLMLRALSSPDLWSEVSHGYASDSVGEHAEDTFAIADHVKRVRGGGHADSVSRHGGLPCLDSTTSLSVDRERNE